MFTLKLLLKRSCWTFIFMALALPATARVCFLPDSTDCGEGDVDVPEVQITCATYGGYETEAACLEARTNKTAQTCTLNSGCYYPKCAYDSERKCKNENPDKNCLSQDVDGVKCWYSQLKTCFDQGYKSACSSDENSTPVNIEAFDGPCYKCTEKATCKQMKPGVYYGPNDTCPQYTDRKDAGVTGKDGVCSTCEPQACTTINAAYKNAANQNTCGSDKEAKKVEGTDSAADGPCYICEDKPLEIVKPVITITYKETYNSLTPSMGADPEEYYYKTLKFTATSSDNISRNILMKTYPAKTCKTQYTTGSPVTINEGTETIIGSHCGTKSAVLPVSSVAALDTFINGTKVYSFEPYYSSHILYDGLDGTTVETNDYTVKFVKGKTCSEISNGSWKGEKDKNTCPTGYKPEVVESTVGATVFSDGPCYKCEEKVTITIALDATNTTVNFSSFSSDNKGYTVKLSLNGGGNDGITYPVTVTEGRTATYFSSTYEPGDCDVYGDNCDNDLGNGRETVSAASNLSVIINDQTVLNNLTTENEYLDMRYFIGKTYDTDNYIIKFVKVQTCSDIGYQTTPCSTGYKQIDYIQLPHEDCYTCSKCYKESSSGTVANKSTIYYYRADEPYKNGECASEMTINVVCDNTNLKAKLYVNGKETQANPNSYQNTEGKWFGDFMNCTGCATVECTFKYGDKTKITIPQTGGPGD